MYSNLKNTLFQNNYFLLIFIGPSDGVFIRESKKGDNISIR